MTTVAVIDKEMKAYISAFFGNDGWVKLVEARYLRKLQAKNFFEYDPKELDAVKVYVKDGPRVPQQIIDELPTHGGDQFGSILARTDIRIPQQASKETFAKLYRARQPYKKPGAKQVSLARRALAGRDAMG